MLLPGGAHFQKLKKNDIVFNADQTKMLLEHGKIAGHARAYANGTADGINAYALHVPQRNVSGSTHTYFDQGTGSNRYNAAGAVNNVANSLDDFKKRAANLFDWIQVRLTYLTNRANDYYARATNLIDRGKLLSANGGRSAAYNSIQRNLQNAINTTRSSITNSRSGYARYNRQAGIMYEHGKQSLTGNDRTTFINAVKRLQEGGAIDISSYNENVRTVLNEYKKWFDLATDTRMSMNDLTGTLIQYSQELYNLPLDRASQKLEQFASALDLISGRAEIARQGGSAIANYEAVVDNAKTDKDNKKSLRDKALEKKKKADSKAKTAKENSSIAKEEFEKQQKKLKEYTSFTKEQKAAIAAGKKIENVDKIKNEKVRKQAEKYNALLSNKNKQNKIYNNALKEQDSATSAYNTAENNFGAASRYYSFVKDEAKRLDSNHDKRSYQYANALEFEVLSNMEDQYDANTEAYVEASRNNNTAVSNQKKAKNQVDAKIKSITNNSKLTKNLTKAQLEAIKSGKAINTSSIKDKDTLKAINEYNKLVDQATQANIALEASNTALTTAEQNASQAAIDLANARTEYAKNTLANIAAYFDNAIEYNEKLNEENQNAMDMNEAKGQYESQELLGEQMQNNADIIDLQKEKQAELEKQLEKLVGDGYIKEGSEEWNDYQNQIADAAYSAEKLRIENEKIARQKFELGLEIKFKRAIELSDRLISKLNTISDLISEEMMFDYDTGELTSMGVLSATLQVRELDESLSSLQGYVKERQKIIDAHNKGMTDENGNLILDSDGKVMKLGEKEFNEQMKAVEENIQSSIKNADSARKAIIDIVKKQTKAEKDALFEVMDARKEAWKKQKEYYDWDKTLKNKTKDIQLLEQQIQALNGVEDAESRAQKARLEAQKAQMQEELGDTVRDHVYEMKVTGIEDLQKELDKDYERYVNELSSNFEKMSEVVANATTVASDNISDSMDDLTRMLAELFKIAPEDLGLSQNDIAPKPNQSNATGTKSAKSGWSRINENGREMILTNRGEMLVPLNNGDKVFTKAMTDNLWSIAKNADYGKLMMSEVKLPDSARGSETISPVIECPITIMGNANEQDVISAVNKVIPKISKTVQNDIRKDLRKSGLK